MKSCPLEFLHKTKSEARKAGDKHYFTGQPCSRGHIDKRYVSTGQCHSCQRENRASWRLNNPEKERESRVLSLRKWAQANPELKREYARRSNAKPEISAKNVARVRRWAEANPERSAEARHISNSNRRARKRGASGSHTKEDVAEILRQQKYRCVYCGQSIKKKARRHLDHIVPLAKGGSNDKTNLQMLCVECNLKKAAKDPIKFANEIGRLF